MILSGKEGEDKLYILPIIAIIAPPPTLDALSRESVVDSKSCTIDVSTKLLSQSGRPFSSNRTKQMRVNREKVVVKICFPHLHWYELRKKRGIFSVSHAKVMSSRKMEK